MVLYIFTTYDLIEKINNLNKNQKKIILLVLAIIVLVIGTIILKNNIKANKKVWDYKYVSKLDTIEEYIDSANKTSDRVKYWELTSIIDKIINTINEDLDYSYTDLYNILERDYKKNISKKEYNKLAYDFINRFIYDPNNNGEYVKTNYSIKDIYLYGENMYLCYVSVNVDDMTDNELKSYYKNNTDDIVIEKEHYGYIGVKLDEAHETYSIFYME